MSFVHPKDLWLCERRAEVLVLIQEKLTNLFEEKKTILQMMEDGEKTILQLAEEKEDTIRLLMDLDDLNEEELESATSGVLLEWKRGKANKYMGDGTGICFPLSENGVNDEIAG